MLVRDGTPLPEGKFELAFDAPGELSVYRNLTAMPRAWLVRNVATVPPKYFAMHNLDETLTAIDFDPATMAVVEHVEPITLDATVPGQDDTVAIRRHDGARIVLDVVAESPALLVLSEVWYPGWHATVNGVATPVLPTNGALRGVLVPAGMSTVELRFAPATWRIWVDGCGHRIAPRHRCRCLR